MPDHRAQSAWTPATVAAVIGGLLLLATLISLVVTLYGTWSPLSMAVTGVLFVASLIVLAWADGHNAGSTSGGP